MKFCAKKDMVYRILVWGLGLLFLGLSIGLLLPVYHQAGLIASLVISFLFGMTGFFIFWLWFRTFYRPSLRLKISINL